MIITIIPIAKFLEVLATHRACDRYLTCMKLTPELWRQWQFCDIDGAGYATFIDPGERDEENPGAVLFALARAEIVRTVSAGESFCVQ
jgi:hypothetical protein